MTEGAMMGVHRASIDEDHRRVLGSLRGDKASTLEHGVHDFAVGLVHLAAVCFDEEPTPEQLRWRPSKWDGGAEVRLVGVLVKNILRILNLAPQRRRISLTIAVSFYVSKK
jgi:hypothetical protein